MESLNPVRIKIKKPIWNTRSVGIAAHLITGDIEVEILYKKVDGTRLYPHLYKMSQGRAEAYPARTFGNTPELRIIPISAFEVSELS